MAVHLMISGLVQGVGYRIWLQNTARTHGLGGWTRNLSDGCVEAVLTGPEDKIRHVLEEARRGPAGAQVSDIAERPAKPDEAEQGGHVFEIRPTV